MSASDLLARIGIANLPLRYSKAPRWLLDRMVKLAWEITIAIMIEYGSKLGIREKNDAVKRSTKVLR